MNDATRNVLILCTGNSARSILAEALVNHQGQGRLVGFSAGSHPAGYVQPVALEVLSSHGLSTEGLRSKSWDEFGAPGAPPMHLVITVCDQAAHETCPVWPGHPATAHWGIRDPALVGGSPERRRQAFEQAYQVLDARIRLLTALPFHQLDRQALEREVKSIAASVPAGEE